jgi:molecular chaperone DnaK
MNPPAANDAPSQSQQPPVGIDLGTTYSVVACLDNTGRPATVLNHLGELLTPSAVSFEDGQVIVGKEAIKGSVYAPAAYADCFKRDMGRGAFRRPLLGHEVPPEVCNAFLLEQMRRDTEQRLGPIRQVVITVPAFFDEGRRKATQDAGRLAGLEVLDIINEPTAAAVAFGYHHTLVRGAAGEAPPQERLVVYDLGGGTFDVTILEIAGHTFRTLATDGDVQLGGKDWDERLVNYLAENFLTEHGVDPRSDPQDAAQLWIDVQEAKHALSERIRTTVSIFHAGIRMRQEVTRAIFEDLTRDLLERTETTTSLVMKQAGLDWGDVARVLLVGGSTRMPMVGEMLRRLTGKEPDRSQSADEVVAHGAALYAGMLMAGGQAAPRRQFELVNVNSHSLGVVGLDKTGQRVNAILIRKNTPLPCHKVKKFKTARPDQRTVKVAVVEGENQRPEHCIPLGQCVIRDLPPGLPAGTRVEVEYHYASNGRISVAARVPGVRQSAHVEIQRDDSRDLRDLDHWRRVLTGAAAAGPGAPADRAAMIQRLDELLAQVGLSAARAAVPPELERGKRSVLAAAEELRRAQAVLEGAESLRQSAASPTEAARLSAEAAQARLALQQARTNATFAQLVLGRDSISASFHPPEVQAALAEIRRLQQRLGTA